MSRDLIIVRSGERSLHPFWREPDSQVSWDIFVCPFQPLPTALSAPGVTVGEVRQGPKWTGLRDLLNAWPGWRDYRYVMLADDDLMMPEAAITTFFELCAAFDAKLAQPALTGESPTGHVMVLGNSAFGARQVTFVEVMMPTFRADVLAELLWTLDLTETGWGFGLDALWSKLLDYDGLMIFDATPVFHTRPIGQARGPEMERRVRSEMQSILTRFDCPFVRMTRVGHTADGRQIADPDPVLLHQLIRGYDRIFEHKPHLLPLFIRQQSGAGEPAP